MRGRVFQLQRFDLRLNSNKENKNTAGTKPRVLIVSIEKSWVAIVQLPKYLQRAGFEVAALCYCDSLLAFTQYLDALFPCHSRRRGGSITRQFVKIVQDWNAQIIVPGDERTLQFFRHMLQLHDSGKYPLPPDVLEKLRFSFGNFDWLPEAASKRLTLQRAIVLGLKTPKFLQPSSLEEANNFAKKLGWPVVLKKSNGYGGGGVAFCENEQQLSATYRKYEEASQFRRIIKSYLLEARGWRLSPAWETSDNSFSMSEFISGTPATVALAAANGKILARAAALNIKCYPQITGMASVLRIVSHPGMFHIVEKMVAHWGASGFLGFDFMVDGDGVAYLLECNGRPTSLTYMGDHAGCDLCLAYFNQLKGREIPAPSVPRHELIAHFPSEWRRDPCSSFLREAYHDVPWDDPPLLSKLVKDFR